MFIIKNIASEGFTGKFGGSFQEADLHFYIPSETNEVLMDGVFGLVWFNPL